jgi:hypothetical protein
MRYAVACVLTVLFPALAAAAADDAWPLYKRASEQITAGDLIGKSSPSASDLLYYGYPPYSPEWERMAKAAYEHNAGALAEVRRATAINTAAWPVEKVDGRLSLAYLNSLRNVSNQVGDAALYEYVRGDHAAAVTRVGDLLHMADLLDAPPNRLAIQMLVAVGLRSLALDRLQTISAGVRLIDRPAPGDKAVPVADVEALIKRLFTNNVNFDPEIDLLVANEQAIDPQVLAKGLAVDKFKVQLQRNQTERNLAAMALACRLFHHRNNRWPASLDELSTLLPAPPVDALGPMGYVLVKGDLPNAGDRPLVYSRAGVPAGGKPAYPTTEPQYGYYVNLSAAPVNRTAPGQFRDVTTWPGKLGAKMAFKPLD